MTEDDALLKWCPFARATERDDDGFVPAHNRYRIGEFDGSTDAADAMATKCIASECMAWRWTGASQTRGYCGLAGRPE